MSQTTHRTTRRQPAPAEPDLVDRIFEYIFSDPALASAVERMSGEQLKLQAIKAAVRSEFQGEECYIASRPATERERVAGEVLALFNGRNASEVARTLRIGRATVYRILKQSGRVKSSQFSGK